MKYLLFITSILLLTLQVSAQNLKFGPVVGGVITNQYEPEKSVLGVNLGLFLEYGKGNWALETDLVFLVAKGSPYRGSLILPIHLKYYLGDIVYVKCGPTFGLKPYDMDLQDHRRRYFVGMGCGLGCKIFKRFYVDLIYDRALTSISYKYSTIGLSLKWNLLKTN